MLKLNLMRRKPNLKNFLKLNKMSNLEQIKKENINKRLIKIDDICVSKKYGVGYVIEVSPEDVWYPIQILFKQNVFSFGDCKEERRCFHYSARGCTNSIHIFEKNGEEVVDAIFYTPIKI